MVTMCGFFVDERAQVFVKDEIANRHFLEGIDPKFWAYQAIVHGEQLEAEDKELRQRAAAALRIAYGQGVEALFALVGAFVQLPAFPLAWLMQYTNTDLREVVRKIHGRRGHLPSPLKARPSWTAIAHAVFEHVPEPTRSEMTTRYARFWYRLADEFLDETFEPEYNNLKHGMRAHVGGFAVAIGPARPAGTPADPDETRQTVGATEYGSTYWKRSRKIPGCRFTYELGNSMSCAWSPQQFALALPLIGMSIQNIVSRALVTAGDDPRTRAWVFLSDADTFDRPWRDHRSIKHISFGVTTELGGWEEPTDDEIRRVYEGNDADSPEIEDEI
jgi:hypothetical protein